MGELGLIDGMRRSANVTAIEPVECYFLPREAFLNALEENPEIAIRCFLALPAWCAAPTDGSLNSFEAEMAALRLTTVPVSRWRSPRPREKPR